MILPFLCCSTHHVWCRWEGLRPYGGRHISVKEIRMRPKKNISSGDRAKLPESAIRFVIRAIVTDIAAGLTFLQICGFFSTKGPFVLKRLRGEVGRDFGRSPTKTPKRKMKVATAFCVHCSKQFSHPSGGNDAVIRLFHIDIIRICV
jgi:hypothetical protein